jgi:hypothetical protein
MHLPCLSLRPRLRLRTLLIVVVVAGLALGGWTMWKRREYCLERIRSCKFWEKPQEPPSRLGPYFDGPPTAAQQAEWRAWARAYAKWSARMRPAYERVARYPWLPLPPEPE